MSERMMRQLRLLTRDADSALARAFESAGLQARSVAVALAASMPRGSVHPELLVRDSMVLMLQVAAEIEHALMLQYLFAAYSLRDAVPIPGSTSGATTSDWRELIIQTAREEMGHFLTVQNALILLGGPLHLERDNFPHRSRFYPFEFKLERLTMGSLSRYISAEMPEERLIPSSILTAGQLAAIRVTSGGAVNRVGLLFAAIADAIAELDNREDLWPQHQPWQADGLQWNANFVRPGDLPVSPTPARGVVVSQMLTKAELAKVLGFVATQGESPDLLVLDSHFARFAKIYREWDAALVADAAFDPAYDILENPNTTMPPDPSDVLTPAEQSQELQLAAGRIHDAKTELWAHLFNVRYRILLMTVQHSLMLGPTTVPESRSPRPLVRDILAKWAFEEMTYAVGSIRDMALLLVTLPSGNGGKMAGSPFELPYSIELPALGPARWRLYRDLFDISADLVRQLKAMTPTVADLDILNGIVDRDGTTPTANRRKFIESVKDLEV